MMTFIKNNSLHRTTINDKLTCLCNIQYLPVLVQYQLPRPYQSALVTSVSHDSYLPPHHLCYLHTPHHTSLFIIDLRLHNTLLLRCSMEHEQIVLLLNIFTLTSLQFKVSHDTLSDFFPFSKNIY